MSRRFVAGFVVSLALAVAATVGAAARTSVDLCGTTVVADVTLDQDVACPGDGLFAGADDIVIDLNGHTLSGLGVGVGITVRGRQRVTVRGGTVRDFLTGVFVTGGSSDVTVTESLFTGNREGVFIIGSSGNTVSRNMVWNNLLRGVMIRPTSGGVISTNNLVVANILLNNPSGILNFGQPGNTLEANSIVGSSVAAIDLTDGGASGNVIKLNFLGKNAAGIRLMPGWTGNDIEANWFVGNTCGVQGPTAGNTLTSNVHIQDIANSCV